MDENKIIEQAVDTNTDKPFPVEITRKDLSAIDRLLILLRLEPAIYKFIVAPVTVGNFERIAKTVRQIPDDIFQKGLLTGLMQVGDQHIDKYIYIVAVGLRNKKKEPSKRFLSLLKSELQWQEIAYLYDQIMKRVGLLHFMNSTISIKGADILKMGLKSEEIIAS